ncbi:band 7 protein AGAP004871 isoform X2 [Drosophila biarmipes]|uniref:band 7 protein AGAP004871 isoform X2 n=1 Tax=Drosophila biarmipes TaxID=125945 RepID=UPI0021CC648A|nr:band 7 protein AGAP004871 isoform X2 [Drosophila biarmipes]
MQSNMRRAISYFPIDILVFEKVAVVLSWICVVLFFPFSLCCCIFVVRECQRIVVFRLGRVRSCSGPGLVFMLPCIDSFRTVDIRTDVIDSDPQDMLTKDSVTITVNAAVFHHVFNPIDWFIKVDDGNDAIRRICQVTLRSIVGSKNLHEVLTSREQLSLEIQDALAELTTRWGARVTRVGLLEIVIPSSIERSLAAEAEAAREARAKIILAEGDAKASQALKECSDVMSGNQITLQLRHLQILSSMAKERRVNVIFPIPLQIMEPFSDGKKSPEPAKKDDDMNLYSPKVYIIGPPPETLPDPNPNPNPEPQPEPQPDPESGTVNGSKSSAPRGYQETNPQEAANRENVGENRLGRTWQWPPFFRPSPRPPDGEQPSGSRRAPVEDGQRATGRGTNQTNGVEPYPLLTKPPTRSGSPSTKPTSIPLPPRPDPPTLPPVPSHPTLPPIPPHPSLPPLPERPTPPPKSTSPPAEKDPRVTKPDKNYYF